ncbi:unnamed protein product, partial [Choristocarpus tenellus]
MRLTVALLSFGAMVTMAPKCGGLSASHVARLRATSLGLKGSASSQWGIPACERARKPWRFIEQQHSCQALRSRHLRRSCPGSGPLWANPTPHDEHNHNHDHSTYGGVAGSSGVDKVDINRVNLGELDGLHDPALLSSHGGHSHCGAGHSHAHFHLDVKSLKAKPTLIRLVLAATCVLALPLWRRSSRLEWGALGGVCLFLGAVDAGKFAINRLRVSFGELYLGWRNHSGLSVRTLNMAERDRAREVDAITWIGAFVNIGLAGFKFFAGIVGHSAAMIADAGHSLSDLVSDAVTLWAVRLSRLPPDDDHPYGHGRFEALGAFVISVMLLTAGYGIGNHSYETLVQIIHSSKAAAVGGVGGVSAHAHVPTRLTAMAATV